MLFSRLPKGFSRKSWENGGITSEVHTSEEEKGVGFCKRERGNEITRIEKRKGEGDASESEVKKNVARLANDFRRRSWGGRKMRGEKSDEREPNWKKNDLMGGVLEL